MWCCNSCSMWCGDAHHADLMAWSQIALLSSPPSSRLDFAAALITLKLPLPRCCDLSGCPDVVSQPTSGILKCAVSRRGDVESLHLTGTTLTSSASCSPMNVVGFTSTSLNSHGMCEICCVVPIKMCRFRLCVCAVTSALVPTCLIALVAFQNSDARHSAVIPTSAEAFVTSKLTSSVYLYRSCQGIDNFCPRNISHGSFCCFTIDGLKKSHGMWTKL